MIKVIDGDLLTSPCKPVEEGGKYAMITILAPAYNEEPVIEKFVLTVMKTLHGVFSFELLIVNDGSIDKTGEILSRLQKDYDNLVVVTHPVNRGLGAGLCTGFKHARGDVIVTMDADLSQSPGLVLSLVNQIDKGGDLVIGSRYVLGGGMEGVPWWRQAISLLGNMLIRTITGIPAKDCTSGLRAYKKCLLNDLKEVGNGFDVQLTLLRQLYINRSPIIKEVPLLLKERVAGQSKMRYLTLIPKYILLLAKPIKL